MFTKFFAFGAGVIALSLTNLTLADEALSGPMAEEQATVIVYRADESIKTRRINFDVHVDAGSVGRLNARDSLSAVGDAGHYTISTSLPGDEPLELQVKPGTTHYVHTRLRMVGNRLIVELVEVEEQVAKAQQADNGELTI